MTPQKYKESWEITMINKMNKIKEMDKFLEIYYLPRLNQQELGTMKRQINSNKIGSIIKKPSVQNPGLMVSQVNSTKHLKKNWHLSDYYTYSDFSKKQKQKQGKLFWIHSMKPASSNIKTRPRHHTHTNKTYRPMSLVNIIFLTKY